MGSGRVRGGTRRDASADVPFAVGRPGSDKGAGRRTWHRDLVAESRQRLAWLAGCGRGTRAWVWNVVQGRQGEQALVQAAVALIRSPIERHGRRTIAGSPRRLNTRFSPARYNRVGISKRIRSRVLPHLLTAPSTPLSRTLRASKTGSDLRLHTAAPVSSGACTSPSFASPLHLSPIVGRTTPHLPIRCRI